MLNTPAGAQSLHQGVLFVPNLIWDEHCDRFSDGFGLGIPKQTLGSRVPTHNGPVQTLGDDRVVGRFDQDGKSKGRLHRPAKALFTFPKLFLPCQSSISARLRSSTRTARTIRGKEVMNKNN